MGRLGHWLHKAWSSARGMSVPSRCAICRQWPAEPVCESCITRFAHPIARCLTCALPVPEGVLRCGACLRHPPPLARCLSAVDYGWPWRPLVARFKFQAQPAWDRPLVWLMRSAAWAEDTLHEADLVLPIPLARERLAERGYNQSWLLARRLAPGPPHREIDPVDHRGDPPLGGDRRGMAAADWSAVGGSIAMS